MPPVCLTPACGQLKDRVMAMLGRAQVALEGPYRIYPWVERGRRPSRNPGQPNQYSGSTFPGGVACMAKDQRSWELHR